MVTCRTELDWKFVSLKSWLLFMPCPWSHGLRPKKLSVSVAEPPAPVRVPSQRPLAPCVASVKSVANDKGDNEMILGAVHRSPGIFLTAEENPQKTSARIPSDEEAVRPVIAWNGIPFLQMRSVASHSTSGREKEGRKGGRDGIRWT